MVLMAMHAKKRCSRPIRLLTLLLTLKSVHMFAPTHSTFWTAAPTSPACAAVYVAQRNTRSSPWARQMSTAAPEPEEEPESASPSDMRRRRDGEGSASAMKPEEWGALSNRIREVREAEAAC